MAIARGTLRGECPSQVLGKGSRFRVEGWGFRVQGFRVEGLGFRV